MVDTVEKSLESPNVLIDCYTMFYKDNTGNYMKSKNFRCAGGLKKARARAEIHAGLMEYRLFHVQALISNLTLEEDFHLGRRGDSEVLEGAKK